MWHSNVHQRHGEHGGDYEALVKMAFRHIKERCLLHLDHLEDVEVRSEPGTYKVEWVDPNGEDILTLYQDGVWEFYGAEGSADGKVTPLHHRTWVAKEKVPGAVSYFAVEYFKNLLKKEK